jgi:hypothetical protein
MTHLSFDQRQAALARGRSLQTQAIRQAFAALYLLPARLLEALSHRDAAKTAGHKGHHAA